MQFLRTLFAFALLLATAVAFTPVARTRSVSALRMGYVPDGLSPKEYEALKKKEADAAAKNKKKFKNKPFETLDDWNIARSKKFPNSPGAGHRFVKLKYEETVTEATKPRGGAGMN